MGAAVLPPGVARLAHERSGHLVELARLADAFAPGRYVSCGWHSLKKRGRFSTYTARLSGHRVSCSTSILTGFAQGVASNSHNGTSNIRRLSLADIPTAEGWSAARFKIGSLISPATVTQSSRRMVGLVVISSLSVAPPAASAERCCRKPAP